MLDLIPTPGWVGERLQYATSARRKRMFHGVLDAAEQLVDGSLTSVSLQVEGDLLALHVHSELRAGTIEDRIEHHEGLHLRKLERRVTSHDGAASRHEIVDFASRTHPLPPCTYVEVGLPFLLGAQPLDGKVRSLYAWICDRFVAKVYYESRGKETLHTPRGRFDTREVVMYPDLNDWVKLPSILTKLGKPFLPKYHMWYELAPPHRLVRFEGPYGPPGAPEIVLELG